MSVRYAIGAKDCFCPSGTTFSIQGLPRRPALPMGPILSCLRYSSPYIIPALASLGVGLASSPHSPAQ